jgi:hypothetical protein
MRSRGRVTPAMAAAVWAMSMVPLKGSSGGSDIRTHRHGDGVGRVEVPRRW